MFGDDLGVHSSATTRAQWDINVGLRDYMRSVFNKMALALLVSGLTAMITVAIFGAALKGGLGLLFALIPLPFVFVLSYGIHKFEYATAQVLFLLFAVAMGMSMSSLFLMFTAKSVALVFFITAATFASASLVGYTTRMDLSRMGSFLIMGLIGILIAIVVNIFLASPVITFVVSILGVLIFTGLTAYDVQNLRNDYLTNGEIYGFDSPERSALYGALSLYLNFVNIFQFLLNLLGSRE